MMNSQQIKMHRKELGLSQKELAEKLGVTNFTVSRWERGVANPKPYIFTALKAMSKDTRASA